MTAVRLRVLFSLTVSPMVLSAIALIVLVVAPLGGIPASRDGLAAALEERNAIHDYAVAVEQDTFAVLGRLEGRAPMAASTAAMARWHDVLDRRQTPQQHVAVQEEAAAAHAQLLAAATGPDHDSVPPAFNAALEAAGAGLQAVNDLIDTRLGTLAASAPRIIAVDPAISEANQHLTTDRAMARYARSLGQLGVELAVADMADKGRVQLALIDAERVGQLAAATGHPAAPHANTFTLSALSRAQALIDNDEFGPDALAELWPLLEAALSSLEDIRRSEGEALASNLQSISDRAAAAAWAAGVIVIGLAAAAPVAGWALTRRVLRPVLALHRAADATTSEDPSELEATAAADEVGDLTRSFADMTRRVNATTQQLRAALEESNLAREALQRSLEKLSEADQLRQHILNTASHELRTPLTPIRIHMKLLADETQGPLTAKQQRSLDVLDANLTRLVSVISEMAQMHELQAGNAPMHMTNVDITEVAQTACLAARSAMEAAHIDLVCEASGPVVAHADAAKLTQALEIVLDNARLYTPAGGTVTVRVRADRRIEVSDTGRGMASEDVARLFSPFERGMGQQHDAPGAAGLGLAIARAIMEGMGGTITGRSDGLGLGSTFVLALDEPSL